MLPESSPASSPRSRRLALGSSNLVYFSEPTLRTQLHMSVPGPKRQFLHRNHTSEVGGEADMPRQLDPTHTAAADSLKVLDPERPIREAPPAAHVTLALPRQPCSNVFRWRRNASVIAAETALIRADRRIS